MLVFIQHNFTGFPLWSIYTLFSQILALLYHFENCAVSISNPFFKIGPLFLAFYREDEKTIAVSLQEPLTYLSLHSAFPHCCSFSSRLMLSRSQIIFLLALSPGGSFF